MSLICKNCEKKVVYAKYSYYSKCKYMLLTKQKQLRQQNLLNQILARKQTFQKAFDRQYNQHVFTIKQTILQHQLFQKKIAAKQFFSIGKHIHNLFKILNKTQHYTYSGSIYFVPKHFPSEGQYYNKCLKEICTTGF